MPDFLGRIAERALGLAEVVQPRVAPLFATGDELAPEAVIESDDTVVAPRNEPPATPPVARVHPTLVEPTVESAPTSTLDAPGGEGHASMVEYRLAAREEAAAAVPPRRELANQGIETPPRGPVGVPLVRETEPPLLLPERRAVVQTNPATELTRESARALAPGLAVVTPFGAPQPLSRTQNAPPTVRVTIGRVEVRAVFPAPESPRPAPAPPQPSLTLDEYVRQRREGVR